MSETKQEPEPQQETVTKPTDNDDDGVESFGSVAFGESLTIGSMAIGESIGSIAIGQTLDTNLNIGNCAIGENAGCLAGGISYPSEQFLQTAFLCLF